MASKTATATKVKNDKSNKKQKKKFDWSKVTYYLKTLYRNDSCVEVGAKTNWIWTTLLFIFSIGLAMLPLAINTVRTNGSNYVDVTGYRDSYEYGLKSYMDDEDASDIIFTDTDDGIQANISGSLNGEVVYSYTRQINDGTSTTEDLVFTLYYYEYTDDSFDSFIDNLNETDLNGNERDSTYVVFGKENFYAKSYSSASTTTYAINGNYKYFYDFIDEETGQFSFKEYLSLSTEDYTANSSEAIFENFCQLVDNAYITNRNNVTGVYIGISIGIDGGLVLLMGIVYFCMTRGKTNEYKPYKWYQFIGMSVWASFTPALITLVLGFFLTGGYEIMIFIFAFGFRAMYLSMRQLRPQSD